MRKIVSFSALLAILLVLSGCGAASAFRSAGQTTLPDENAVPLAIQPMQTVSRDQAQEIALKHAGFTAGQVTGLRIELDGNHWDVDFRAGDWEYEYDIHARTGDIIQADKEYDSVKASVPQSTVPQPVGSANRLIAEEAKVIALQHAALTEDAVRFLRVEFDYDDGVPRYEVEFVADGWEYEYDIHAQTGAILSFDKDR